jgi:hypothetical protein
VKDQIEKANESIVTTVDGVSGKMQGLVDVHSKQVDTSIEQLEKSLENVLGNSLNSLGGQLASLSNKFAEDYTCQWSFKSEPFSVVKTEPLYPVF